VRLPIALVFKLLRIDYHILDSLQYAFRSLNIYHSFDGVVKVRLGSIRQAFYYLLFFLWPPNTSQLIARLAVYPGGLNEELIR
jgi:hypothetical protein